MKKWEYKTIRFTSWDCYADKGISNEEDERGDGFLVDENLFNLWRNNLSNKEEVLAKAQDPAGLAARIAMVLQGFTDSDDEDEDDDDEREPSWEEELNEQGRQGWELVSVIHPDPEIQQVVAVLKREIGRP
ncbi:MAG TPA: hypothetical protein VMR25_21680 [Planctomycetaceae bacterium]|nr:hypothetical protein [Planctomycetaceae bacterium]